MEGVALGADQPKIVGVTRPREVTDRGLAAEGADVTIEAQRIERPKVERVPWLWGKVLRRRL